MVPLSVTVSDPLVQYQYHTMETKLLVSSVVFVVLIYYILIFSLVSVRIIHCIPRNVRICFKLQWSRSSRNLPDVVVDYDAN